MRRRIVGVAAVLLMLGVAWVAATGSVVTTVARESSSVTAYTMVWTATSGGAVSAVAVPVQGGKLESVAIVPGATTSQPTDLYDLTLLTSDGIDLLSGRGTDMSNVTGSIMVFDPPMFLPASQIYPTVANAGSGKAGTLVLRMER